jgi:hypothetical protein
VLKEDGRFLLANIGDLLVNARRKRKRAVLRVPSPPLPKESTQVG